MIEGKLLYSKSTDSNINHIYENTFPEISRIMSDRISWHQDSANVIHKVNHNTEHRLDFSSPAPLLSGVHVWRKQHISPQWAGLW